MASQSTGGSKGTPAGDWLAKQLVDLRVDVWRHHGVRMSAGEALSKMSVFQCDGGPMEPDLPSSAIPLYPSEDFLWIPHDDEPVTENHKKWTEKLKKYIDDTPDALYKADAQLDADINDTGLVGILETKPLKEMTIAEKVYLLAEHRLFTDQKDPVAEEAPKPNPDDRTMFLLRLNWESKIVLEKHIIKPTFTIEEFLDWIEGVAEPYRPMLRWRNATAPPWNGIHTPRTDEELWEMAESSLFESKYRNPTNHRALWSFMICHQDENESKLIDNKWASFDAPDHFQQMQTAIKDVHNRPVFMRILIWLQTHEVEEARMLQRRHPDYSFTPSQSTGNARE